MGFILVCCISKLVLKGMVTSLFSMFEHKEVSIALTTPHPRIIWAIAGDLNPASTIRQVPSVGFERDTFANGILNVNLLPTSRCDGCPCLWPGSYFLSPYSFSLSCAYRTFRQNRRQKTGFPWSIRVYVLVHIFDTSIELKINCLFYSGPVSSKDVQEPRHEDDEKLFLLNVILGRIHDIWYCTKIRFVRDTCSV